jgi:hypothetical protein
MAKAGKALQSSFRHKDQEMVNKMVITVAMIWLAEFPPRFVAAAPGAPQFT